MGSGITFLVGERSKRHREEKDASQKIELAKPTETR
jgi:hypothetical protein